MGESLFGATDPAPGATATPTPAPAAGTDPAPVVYDLEADPLKLGELDLGGALLAGKYKTVKELAAGYGEAQKALGARGDAIEAKLKAKYGPPEAYDFSAFEGLADEARADLGAKFKEQGFSQAQAEWALRAVAELTAPASVEREVSALGEAWGTDEAGTKAKLGELRQWVANRYGAGAAEFFLQTNAFATAEAILDLDRQMKGAQDRGTFQGAAVPGGSVADQIAALERSPDYYDWTAGRRGPRFAELQERLMGLRRQLLEQAA